MCIRSQDHVFGDAMTIPVFLNNGSNPSWIKERCVKQFRLPAFAYQHPTRLSGVGRGSTWISHDVTIKLGLLSADNDVV